MSLRDCCTNKTHLQALWPTISKHFFLCYIIFTYRNPNKKKLSPTHTSTILPNNNTQDGNDQEISKSILSFLHFMFIYKIQGRGGGGAAKSIHYQFSCMHNYICSTLHYIERSIQLQCHINIKCISEIITTKISFPLTKFKQIFRVSIATMGEKVLLAHINTPGCLKYDGHLQQWNQTGQEGEISQGVTLKLN